jgi:hypothetical protein
MVPVVDRESVGPGQLWSGPMLISDSSSTCAIGDRDSFSIDDYGNLRIVVGARSSDD